MTSVEESHPLVTVVIPLYNGAKYIRRSLRSVLEQSYRDFELVVIDDGSTDGCGDIVLEFTDRRLRLVRQENAGVSAARNRGISESRGRYIAFLDADDEWDTGFLEAVVSLSQEYPSSGMYCTGYQLVFPAGPCVEITAGEAARQVTTLLVTDYFHRANGGSFINASGVMIPREIFEELGGFLVGEYCGEDTEMWARIALRYPVAYDTRILVSFFQTGSDDKPRFKRRHERDPKVWMLESYLAGPGNGFVDRGAIRAHVKSHVRKKCLSFAFENERDAAVSYMAGNDAKNWTPLLNLLIAYRPGWSFLRCFAILSRLCSSRLGMKMAGGKRVSYGVLKKLER